MKHAILLGSHATALAVARSLASCGVPVVVSGVQSGIALRSRFCAGAYTYPDPLQWAGFWKELLLEREALAGGVLLATNDEALEFIAKNHAALAGRYLLDMRRPELHLALLDKRRTLELARAAGVATPNFWSVAGPGDLQRALAEACYPVLVKPLHSHVFRAIFGRKHFIAHDAEDLTQNARIALDAGVACMICELIPGPDSLLSSYYTYLTPEGEALFDFTKRVVRRYPVNEGFGTYHATEWLPRTAEAGRRFFRGIGFQGLGNVEFKLDRRDGQLKLIECNARFTAAQALVARAGVDTAWIAYSRAIGAEAPRIRSYREHLYLWNPSRDYRAFRQLHRQGKLSLAGWLRSLARPKITPYFQWNDPMPSLVMLWDLIRGFVARPARPLVRPVQRPA